MSATANVTLPQTSRAGLLLFCQRQGWACREQAGYLSIYFHPEDLKKAEAGNWVSADRHAWVAAGSSTVSYDSDFAQQLRPFLSKLQNPTVPGQVSDELALCEAFVKFRAAGKEAELITVEGQLVLDVQIDEPIGGVELQEVQIG